MKSNGKRSTKVFVTMGRASHEGQTVGSAIVLNNAIHVNQVKLLLLNLGPLSPDLSRAPFQPKLVHKDCKA